MSRRPEPQVRRVRRALGACLVVAGIVAGACETPDFGSNIDQGLIVATVAEADGGLVVRAQAQFVEDGRITADQLSQLGCYMSGDLRPGSLIDYDVPASGTTMSAGDVIEVRHSAFPARRDSLKPAIVNGGFGYDIGELGIPVSPEDTLTFTVPGDAAGFPTSEVRSAMVPQIVAGPIPVPAAGSLVRVTWSPVSAAPGSYVLMQIVVNGIPPYDPWWNATINCRFQDTGEGWLDSAMSARWVETVKSRSRIRLARERITVVQTGPKKELYLYAVFGQPMTGSGTPIDTTP